MHLRAIHGGQQMRHTHTHTLIDARTDSKAVPHASLSKPPKGSGKLKVSRAQNEKRTSDRMTARRALARYR